MQCAAFTPGNQVLYFGESYECVEWDVDARSFKLQSQTGSIKLLTLKTVLEQYMLKNLRLQLPSSPPPLNKQFSRRGLYSLMLFASEDAKREAETRLKFLRFLTENDVALMFEPFQAAVRAFNDGQKKAGLVNQCIAASISTVRKWKRRLAAHNGCIDSLVPMYHVRGGAGIPRMTDEVATLLQAAVDNQGAMSSRRAYLALRDAINEENQTKAKKHKVPSYATYLRFRDGVDDYQKHAARHGRMAADYVFRSSTRLPPMQNSQFMDVWEMDHAVLDVVVVDRELNLVLWRPRVTVIIERVSRAIVGLTIGFETTSADTALTCLAMAIQPKVASAMPAGVELISHWSCYGVPQAIRVDNGPEFHDESFRAACAGHGIEIIYCPRRKPWFKGAVERTIKTLNHQLVRSLPGASLPPYLREQVGANRDPSVHPEKMAVLDLFDLRRAVYNWAVEQYMRQPHRGLKNRTPATVWTELATPDRLFLPIDPDFVELMATKVASRTPTHTGIQVCSLPYFNSPELKAVRRRYGLHRDFKVRVRYSPRKLDRIWFEDPDSHEWHEIFNHDPESSQMSEATIQLVNRKMALAAKADMPISFSQARKSMQEDLERILLQGKPKAALKATRMLGLEVPSQALKSLEQASQGMRDSSQPATDLATSGQQPKMAQLSLIKRLTQSAPVSARTFDRLDRNSHVILIGKK